MRDSAGGLVSRDTLLGVSAAGFGCEGGMNGPGQPANQWNMWERAGKVEAPGLGCDLWRRPEPALDRAAAMGCEVVATSVEWARIEPTPELTDAAVLDRYDGILRMCGERGMETVAVLHDLTHPEWLGEEYWLTPGSPDRFADHAARVVARLGDRCRRWVTLRQPNVVALAGWVGGHHPPGRVGALSDAWAVVDNLLTAHVLAHEVIHELQPDAEVGMGVKISSSYDWHRMFVDLLCARSLGIERGALDAWIDERRVLHDVAVTPRDVAELVARRVAGVLSPFGSGSVTSAAPSRTDLVDRLRSRLRRPSPRRAVDAVYGGAHPRPLDSVVVLSRPPQAGSVAWPWRTIPPSGLRGRRRVPTPPWDGAPGPGGLAMWCKEQAALVPGLPLWVEDGVATGRRLADGTPRESGVRPRRLRAALAAVVDAAEAGVPIAGYLHTLASGPEPTWPDADYGLFEVRPVGDGDGVRWFDHDGSGAPSGDAYRRLVAGIRAGDRTVLDA